MYSMYVEKRDEHVTCISSKMRRKRKRNESASSRSAFGPSRIPCVRCFLDSPRVELESWQPFPPYFSCFACLKSTRHSVPILVLFVVKRPKNLGQLHKNLGTGCICICETTENIGSKKVLPSLGTACCVFAVVAV